MLRVAVLLLGATSLFAQTYDLVLQGGHVIDPKNGVDARRDVAVVNGRIAAVAPHIDAARARQLVRVDGLYVTPGILDIHAHVYASTGIPGAWAGDNSIYPDGFSFRTGVTTLVDAGSSGWRNFTDFRVKVIDRSQTRVFALINIAGYGMQSNMVEQGDFNPEAVAALAAKHKDVVVGVKAAHFEKPTWEQVDAALAAGKLASLPIMVDFGIFLPERPYWKLVSERLRRGDITTHCFRGPVPIVDGSGKVLPYLSAARKRGVIFDVGHGGGSFVWRNAVPAVQQGFFPDSISTDLHTGSMNAGMMDMQTTMSKFLAMGMPLAEVILRSTWKPAQIIRHEELGHLTPGAVADIAVFRLDKGSFHYKDSFDATLAGSERLICELTVKDGKVVWDWNARLGTDYRKLAPNYGIRETETLVMPPR